MNFRCSLRPSEIGRELSERENLAEAQVELQPAEEVCV
jgi:hypothetical protein